MTGAADLTLVQLLLLVLASFFAGTVDAIAGGGGLVTLPALLAAGLPPALALGTNKGQSVFGSGAALLRFAASGLLDRRVAMVTFPAGFAGSLAGAALVLLLPPETLRPLVLVLLVAAAVVTALRPSSSTTPPPAARRSLAMAGALALVLGAYDGFFGPGVGTFLILGLVFLFGAGMREASADAKVVNFASNLAAMVVFGSRGAILWSVALPMAAGQALGGLAGAHLTVRGGDRLVRGVLLAVVAGLIVKLTVDLFGGSS